MSEYQYYEWQAIDRPLNADEIAEVEDLSSHMETVTPTQAIVTYSYGDFKHNEEEVLLKYFDAFLYLANWGSRQLMFRFPKDAVSIADLQAYVVEDHIRVSEHGQYIILDIHLHEEEGLGWIEGEGILSRLVPLREQILQEDYRLLYLAWLKAVTLETPGKSYDAEEEEEEDEYPEYGEATDVAWEPIDTDNLREPPVPAGLKRLNGSLHAFIETFQLDPNMVKAAAAQSADLEVVSPKDLEAAISQLSREECEAFLRRLLKGEPQVSTALKRRLRELSQVKPAKPQSSQRTFAELDREAEKIGEAEQRRLKREAEERRVRELNELAKKEVAAWREVESLIQQQQGRTYDEAVELLVKLRDLAEYQGKPDVFRARMDALAGRYTRSSSLLKRMRNAGLIAW